MWILRDGTKEVRYGCKGRLENSRTCGCEYIPEIALQRIIMDSISEFLKEPEIYSYNEKLVRKYILRIVIRNKNNIETHFKGGFLSRKRLY